MCSGGTVVSLNGCKEEQASAHSVAQGSEKRRVVGGSLLQRNQSLKEAAARVGEETVQRLECGEQARPELETSSFRLHSRKAACQAV
mmetsp:Transcript_55422/g.173881  ORF Transcript_55422/g.173881 Transcript_55422/m.173881 type:complete len:87 (-) Transcript_55422:113-373(-)